MSAMGRATTTSAKILNTASRLMIHLIQHGASRLKCSGCDKFLRALPQFIARLGVNVLRAALLLSEIFSVR